MFINLVVRQREIKDFENGLKLYYDKANFLKHEGYMRQQVKNLMVEKMEGTGKGFYVYNFLLEELDEDSMYQFEIEINGSNVTEMLKTTREKQTWYNKPLVKTLNKDIEEMREDDASLVMIVSDIDLNYPMPNLYYVSEVDAIIFNGGSVRDGGENSCYFRWLNLFEKLQEISLSVNNARLIPFA